MPTSLVGMVNACAVAVMTFETLMSALMLLLQISATAPEVEVVSDARMVEVGQGACRGRISCLGLFNRADGKIYLSEKPDIDTDFGKSVIVHELRHYQQTLTCGPLEKGPSWQLKFWARELDAYCVQHLYLRSMNSGTTIFAPGNDSSASDGKRLPAPVDRSHRVLNVSRLKIARGWVG